MISYEFILTENYINLFDDQNILSWVIKAFENNSLSFISAGINYIV